MSDRHAGSTRYQGGLSDAPSTLTTGSRPTTNCPPPTGLSSPGNSSPYTTPHITPLPRRQITVLLMMGVTEPTSFTVLFPFVYLMVRDFHITTDPKAIGLYVGMVASAFPMARLSTGMLWGFLSDRVGRRPILLTGVMGSIVCSLLFGLSHSQLWVILVRAVWGGLNGSFHIAKSIFAEITDETNQAKAFSLLPCCRNLGIILGPMIGGLLSNPVENYSRVFGESALFANNASQNSASTMVPCSYDTATQSTHYNTYQGNGIKKPSPDAEGGTNGGAESSTGLNSPSSPVGKPPLSARESLAIAFNRDTLKFIAGYFGLALLAIMFDELHPVWAATDPDLGGIGLTVQTIGLTLSTSGAAVLYVQIVAYPKVQRYLGSLLRFRYGAILFSVLLFTFPFISSLEAYRRTAPYNTADSSSTFASPGQQQPIRLITWIALIVALFAKVCGNTFCFTSAHLLINNSVPSREALGTVNGFSQSVGSLAKAIGPIMAGALWSWSLANGYSFSLDYHFIFIIASLIALATYLVTFTWHPRINRQAFAKTTSKSVQPGGNANRAV
ncbi:major facilitator superfamily domain-containing protein [Dimargaris cristalligena]|uniref:Major facilitator superfamily domain-containing protein n=1 Tax=Dimargaris cristalligena TaxID=215637 RepID=A0A4P9ZMC0_9FUNG|nr:major facilitator superfamily domain-containing protein [Dimargaris cristalligena]|eukprot:RKP34343.1 major facilitator superfamily domain-containing protein [Dimargaris cristalligena]